MLQAIGAVLQIIFLIIKNKFEKDAELKKKREEMSKGAVDAIKNRDVSAINNILVGLRK